MNPIKKNFDFHVEALRGYAAFFVLIYHICWSGKYIDPAYQPLDLSVYAPPGHLSVLVFFVLSGYVIGLTNLEPLTRGAIWPYIKKRLIRIYPIYALCILLALAVAPNPYSWGTILANFTFLQVAAAPVISEIHPIWSLHYEIIFYLLFIPLSYLNLHPILVILTSLVLGIVNYFLFPANTLFTSVCFGFSFWVFGLVLVRYFPLKEEKVNYNLLLSNLFLLLSLSGYNVLTAILTKVSTAVLHHAFEYPAAVPFFERAVEWKDFSYLPYCLLFLLVFSGKSFRFKKAILVSMQLIPAGTLVFLFLRYREIDIQEYVLPTIFYGLSWLFFVWPEGGWGEWLALRAVRVGIWLGAISFGVYICHQPVMALVHQIPFLTGNLLTYLVRVAFYIAASIGVAYFLEKVYHPKMKRLISGPPAVMRTEVKPKT